ncbi:MAG: hypothetical protein C4547_15615 [Phycisphaerales bacterium]|nr:MAG: hypothetical protein C4547_15615 [Phycisphaerales bacterium]
MFRRTLLWLALGWSAALGLVRTLEALAPAGQWDFESYYYAARVQARGGDAYDRAELVREAGHPVFPFVYPHHTMVFFSTFARWDVAEAKAVYFTAKVGCAAALCTLWLVVFVPRPGRLWFLAFVMLGYNAALLRDLVTGNVVTFEQLLLWLGIAALVSGRSGWFCAAVVASAQFKIMGILLLVLAFVRGRSSGWRAVSIGGACTVALGIGVYLSHPELARQFSQTSEALWAQERGGEKNASSRVLIWDIVDAVAANVDALDGVDRRTLGLPIYAGHCLAVVLLTWRTLRRVQDGRIRVYLMILAYALIVPRMRDYSYVLLLVPTFELLRLNLARWRDVPLGLAVLPLVLTLPDAGVVWPYRNFVLAWITWAVSLSLGGVAGGAAGESNVCGANESSTTAGAATSSASKFA